MTGPADSQVRSLLAQRTGTDARDWYLVFKARYGLEVTFRTIAAERGPGAVVTQLFTCSTAVDPILVAGLRPVYAEVSARSICLDPQALVVGADVRAVVIQHTFGIIDEAGAGEAARVAREAGAVVVEDSAHCVARLARDGAGVLGAGGAGTVAPLADVSVHSFGVEKMLPTRYGGAVWVNPALDGGLREPLVRALSALPAVGIRLGLAARLYRTQVRILGRLPATASRMLRRALVGVGLFDPPIADVENRGGLPYAAQRPSSWVTRRIAAALPNLADMEARRARAVAVYRAELAGLVEIPASLTSDQPLVRFPCFATDAKAAEALLAGLTARGHYVGRWYRPALFPGVEDPGAYGYRPGDERCARTEDLIARVVNLPTTVGDEGAYQIAAAVREILGHTTAHNSVTDPMNRTETP